MKHVRASRRGHDAGGGLFDVKASGKIIPVEKKLLFDFLSAPFKYIKNQLVFYLLISSER